MPAARESRRLKVKRALKRPAFQLANDAASVFVPDDEDAQLFRVPPGFVGVLLVIMDHARAARFTIPFGHGGENVRALVEKPHGGPERGFHAFVLRESIDWAL